MIEYAGGDGSSMENAVRITGARDSVEGIMAEYSYLSEKFGQKGRDWDLEVQSLHQYKGKRFDLMNIRLMDGRKLAVVFDITDFFGK